MILYVIELFLVFGFLILSFALTTFSGLLQGFLLHINLINGLFLGAISGSLIYCNNRYIDTFYDHDIHPAICFIAGICIMIAVVLLQKTKVGFWIFTIIMSIVWASVLAGITYLITKDWIWFSVVLGLGTLININSHLRARTLKLSFTDDTD